MPIGNPQVGALATNATTGPITPAHPAVLNVDDLKHLILYSYQGGDLPAVASWVKLDEVDNPDGFGTAALYRRVHQLGDLAPTITGGPGGGLYGHIVAWPGASTTTPEDVAVPPGTRGVGVTLTAQSIDTVTAGAVVAYYFAQGDNSTLGSPTGGATLAYGGAGYSTVVGGDACFAGAYETLAAPGPSGTCAVTASGGQANLEWAAFTVAIRPAPVAVIAARPPDQRARRTRPLLVR